MKIDRLIKELEQIQRKHGNIEVTCTASTDGDSKSPHPQMTGGNFESTVENLHVQEPSEKWDEKRLRLYW